MVVVGCCGFPVSYRRYFSLLPAVEVQQSFYRRLGERQVENWRRAAPEGFTFVLKAPQCVTHPPGSPTYRRSHLSADERRECGFFRLTDVVKSEMEHFLRMAERLNCRVFLFQTPASFKPTDENLRAMESFFSYYRGAGLFAWEPRGKDWDASTVRDLCLKFELVHATDPFLELPPQTETVYFRMHGDLRTYRYAYSDGELERLAAMVRSKRGYVFFNNSNMLDDALRFLSLLV